MPLWKPFDCHLAPPLTHCALTHWGRVTHMAISKLTIIGSDNGLSPSWSQAITWTNVGILLIGPLGTNFSEINRNYNIFSQENEFESTVCKMAAMLSPPQCVKKGAKWKQSVVQNVLMKAFLSVPCIVMKDWNVQQGIIFHQQNNRQILTILCNKHMGLK